MAFGLRACFGFPVVAWHSVQQVLFCEINHSIPTRRVHQYWEGSLRSGLMSSILLREAPQVQKSGLSHAPTVMWLTVGHGSA